VRRRARWLLPATLLLLVGAFVTPRIGRVLIRERLHSLKATVVKDMRALLDAEAAYSMRNGYLYDVPRCLEAQAACVKGSVLQPAAVLAPEVASLKPRAGYARIFHSRPAVAALPPEVASSTKKARIIR